MSDAWLSSAVERADILCDPKRLSEIEEFYFEEEHFRRLEELGEIEMKFEDERKDAFYGDENYEDEVVLECDVCGRGILSGEDYSHFYELNEDICDDCMYDIVDASRRQA